MKDFNFSTIVEETFDKVFGRKETHSKPINTTYCPKCGNMLDESEISIKDHIEQEH